MGKETEACEYSGTAQLRAMATAPFLELSILLSPANTNETAATSHQFLAVSGASATLHSHCVSCVENRSD